MKRILRKGRLTPEAAAKYRSIREQVSNELPELIRRHDERLSLAAQWKQLLKRLKAAREEKGLSLSDMAELTGMDRAAISRLETGQRPNPTIDTLTRYAEAVGKELVVTLADAEK